MTFPNFPKRSSSEDDQLDQVLNDWTVGDTPTSASGLTDNALEFHRWADETRRSDPAATGPAADTWNRVLRSAAQAKPKGKKMSSATLRSQTPGFTQARSETIGESIRRYSSLAATIAIVFAVAIGGWFATVQLNQPGGSDGRFALFGQSDESATCDVEPMSVDQVMEIVENPYRYMDESEYPAPWGSTNPPTPWEDEYQEVQPRLPISLHTGLDTEPTQAAFDQASEVISQYIACLQENPTVAMMLGFSDPFSIQYHIRSEFPLYRTEEQVRAYVAEWLESGEQYHAMTYERKGETLTYRPGQDKSMAGTQIHDFGLGFDQVIYVGSEIFDANGNFVGNFHPGLYMTYNVDDEYLDHGVVFTLLHSRYTGEWYIVTDDWINLDSVI